MKLMLPRPTALVAQEVQEGVSAAFNPSQNPGASPGAAPNQGPAGSPPPAELLSTARALWSEAAELAEARERAQWHELMSRRNSEPNEKLQVSHAQLTAVSRFALLELALVFFLAQKTGAYSGTGSRSAI